MVETVKIKDMHMLFTLHPAFISKDATTDEIAKVMIANPRLKSVYVVDDKLQLIDKISLKMLIKYEFMNLLPGRLSYFGAFEFVGKNAAEDIMIPPVSEKDEDTLKTAFVKMYENDLDELPVVDEKRRLIGNIDLIELLTMLIEKKEQEAGKKYLKLASSRPFYERFR